MSNLDLTITKIMRGDIPVLKIMKGDVEKWPILPYDAEVEYLESTGTQYINTGVHLFTESPTSLEITMKVDVSTSQSIYSVILGSMKEQSPYPGIVIRTNSNNIQIARGSEGAPPTIGTCGSVQSITRNEDNLTFVHNTPVTIFAGLDSNNAPFRYCKLKLYYLKIVKNNNLMLELIPVRKNGIGYLYDKVSGTLFGNQGTGSFNYGNDVVRLHEMPYDTQVEYLQSDGSAFIDTGIIPTLKYSVYLEFKWPSGFQTTTDSSATLFGAFYGWNSKCFMVCINRQNPNIWTMLGNGSNAKSSAATYLDGLLNAWHTLKFTEGLTLIDDTATNNNSFRTYINNSSAQPVNKCFVFKPSLGDNYSDTFGTGTQKQIRSFKMFDESKNIVMDLIPVRVGQVGYMYDKVSRALFGNANSTGAFTFGFDINNKPYDAEVEYLSTDGTAYIDSEIKASSNITAEGEYDVTGNLGSAFAIYGGRIAYNNNSNVLYHYQNQGDGTTNGWRFGNEEKSGSAGNAIGTFAFSSKESANIMKINNLTLTCATSTFATDYNIYVFAMNNGGAASGPNANSVVMRLKYLKFYNSGILVRDYTPVRKNGVGYLYDKVSGQLFGNIAGSGAFTYGDDV